MTLFALVLALAALAAWIYLLVGRGGYWHAELRLPPAPHPQAVWPPVVAVVPARNEADALPETLPALLNQSYLGRFRVVVANDHSSDATADVVRNLAAAPGGRDPDRLGLVDVPALPAGWSGKVWALDRGLAKALQDVPNARYVWFTDADIVHAPDTLSALVYKAEIQDRQLVSVMARLKSRGVWAGLLIPAFVYFFQKLYPFAWVSDPARPKIAGAAGGCVLVRRETLEAAGGLAMIRGALIDDCALARAVRDAGGKLWLGLSETTVSLRPYGTLAAVWDMVARTAFTELDHSVFKLVGTVVGMLVLYLGPPIAFLALIFGAGSAAALIGLCGGLAWLAMAITYLPTLKLYRRPAVQALTLPLCGALYTAMTVDSAIRHWRGRGGAWKGRLQAGGAP